MQSTPSEGAAARSAALHGKQGFSLVEVAILMVILALGLLAMTSTSIAVHTLRECDRLKQIATEAMQSLTEETQAFSQSALDHPDGWALRMHDAYGPSGFRTDRIQVEGLSPWPNRTDVFEIELVIDETKTDQELGVELGMPRDLDRDGDVDNADVRAAARLLPVVLRARWRSPGGERQATHGFYVLGYQ